MSDVIAETTEQFIDQLTATVPDLLSGLLFLVLAGIVVKLVVSLVESSLTKWYPTEQRLIADLVVSVLSVFLWFGVALAFLEIVGLGAIALSLGTSTGFIALGVSYALSEMIEDTVAGVYLLRDPDFNVGDQVETDVGTGTLAAIELRKCRIDTPDGNRLVVANRDIETRWTRDTSGDSVVSDA